MNAPSGRVTGVDLREEINRLKKDRNAIILAHYYQRPEIQDIADYVGDSLELSKKALWQLGRYGETRAAIQEASSIAEGPTGANKLLMAALRMIEARLEFSESHNQLAEMKSKQALNLAGKLYKVTAIQARYVLGLIQSHAGATRAGAQLCESAIDMATQTGDQQLISAALLAHAEVLLDGGDARAALQTALRAQASFAHFGRKESEWRAWLLAARASQRLSQQAVTREYASNANASLTSLEQAWGAEAYRGYASRQDIQRSLKQLGLLLNQQTKKEN